jgi:transcriptional regulator with XRE-family HTH domain
MIDVRMPGESYRDVLRGVAERARALRLRRAIRQDELAERAGIGVATVVRFEKTGRASLENVLRIATALDAEGGFDKLFEMPKYTSLDEALEEAPPGPRRAPRRRR